jgi:2-polyprenyl-3-methyl-5-hydroxy-6-metoxy-1,4-benzoquinol methylase
LLPTALGANVTAFNKCHYDLVYSEVSVDRRVELLQRWRQVDASFQSWFEDATATHMSWHGFYYQDFASALRGRRVLELGSGDGLNATVMAMLGAEVTATDVSTESVRIIEQIASRAGLTHLRALRGSMEELRGEEGSFDYVVGKAFLHHLPHPVEASCLEQAARLLRPTGEARFFEPAVNSALLDRVRWIVPVPGRPSALSRRAFKRWKAEDPHPERDNSSDHYSAVGGLFFREVHIVPMGSLERFYRLMPRSRLQRRYRQWSHRLDERLPMWLRWKAARSQLIVFRRPMGRPGEA